MEEKEKIYKIGFKRNRKDARRHIFRTFKASDDLTAKSKFDDVVSNEGDTKNYRYTLYTGDWSREVAYYDCE